MSCIFTLFYCLLDLSCGECYVIPLYVWCCSVNGSVCFVFGRGCYFVVECYEVVYLRFLDHVWSSKESVCVVHVITEVV